MAATNQAPSIEEESEAAKALWEITNSPGLTNKGPSCLTPRGPACRDHPLGFPTPQGVGQGSPSMNYNRFFSPSQFSWSPLPGHSPAPQPNAVHASHGSHSSSSMPSFLSSLASTTTCTEIAHSGMGTGAEEGAAAVDKAAASAALYAAAGIGGGGGEAGGVIKKKAYSKKLDFAVPSSEKASRVWLSLDTESQRVARTGPRAAPPASPAVAGGGRDSHFFVTQSPFKYQGDGLEDFFASSTGVSNSENGSTGDSDSSGSGSRRGGRPGGETTVNVSLCEAQKDVVVDHQQKWEEESGGGREEGQQLQAVELVTDETSRLSYYGSGDSRGLPFTPLPVNAIAMNQHGGSNWGGIQVRVKKTTPSHTLHHNNTSLLDALAAMVPLHDDASHSPSSLPTLSSNTLPSTGTYHSSMPPPQSPRTTTSASRGKFVPGSPVLEAMAMVALSQSPSVFPSDRKKKKTSLRGPHSAPRVLIPHDSSIGTSSFSSLGSNITITSASATAADAASHPYQTPNSITKKALHLVAAGRNNSPDRSNCNCKKSRCLKLYCECFRGGFTCGASCKCQNCANIPEFEAERIEAREKIEEKKKRKSGGGRQSLGRGKEGLGNCLIAASPLVSAADVEKQQKEHEQEALVPMPLSHSHATRHSTRFAGTPATSATLGAGGHIIFTLKQSLSSSPSSSSCLSTATMTPVQHRMGKRKNKGEEDAAAATVSVALSKPLRRTTPSKGGRKDEFLLSVFGPRSKINKQNSLEVLSYLDGDDMADACLVSSLWNRLALETLDE
ncbi:hypothetical protein VYU27_005761 [Nannochloropsis oceanica]